MARGDFWRVRGENGGSVWTNCGRNDREEDNNDERNDRNERNEDVNKDKNVNVNRPITISNTGVFVAVSIDDSLNDLLDILTDNDQEGTSFQITNGEKVLGTLRIIKGAE